MASAPLPTAAPVVVASFDDPMAAELAALRLAQEGIASQLLDANLLLADPLACIAIGGVKVAVAAADAAAARQVMDRHRQQVTVAKCPDCGSTHLAGHQGGRRAAWLTLLLISFPIGRARGRWECLDCGYRWRG